MQGEYGDVGQTEDWNIAVSYTYQIVGHISKILEYKVMGQLEQSYLFTKSLYHLVRMKMKPEMRLEFDEQERYLDKLINVYRGTSSDSGVVFCDDKDFMGFFDEIMVFLEAKGLITPKGDDPMQAYRGGRR